MRGMARDNFSLSLAAEQQPPVCVGDLDGHRFSVSPNIQTELITKHLRDNPTLPGVLLIEDSKLIGMIPRRTIFERLGRRYGVELFMRKPISELHKELHIEAPLVIDGRKRVEKTLRKALKRPQESIYDPIVIHHNDAYAMLDMQTLIMTQAQILQNFNNVMRKFSDFDDIIEQASPENAIEKVLDSLRGIVPFHNINILLFGETIPSLSHPSSYFEFVNKDPDTLPEHHLAFSFSQTICMDDENGIELWDKNISRSPQPPKAWMSIPLACPDKYIGLLSLYRYTHTAYSNNEKELATTFAWYLSQAVTKLIKERRYTPKPIKYKPTSQIIKRPKIDEIRRKEIIPSESSTTPH
jgi:hypothetical protein